MSGDCEVCGERDAEYTAIIEGARMHVCGGCARAGKIIESPGKPSSNTFSAKRPQTEIELVADFGTVIKSARERIHIGREVLAERISEKESYLERIEAGKTMPSEELAKKLERELGIKLLEEVGVGDSSPKNFSGNKKVTLGDLVFVKKKK